MRKLGLLIIVGSLFVQLAAQEISTGNRPAAVAGSFYAGNADDLRRDLEFLFSRALPARPGENPLAIIVPHAGYPYSGEVAATGFNQIDPKKKYKNIFIIGSSHRYSFPGAAIYSSGNFETPFGEVEVNKNLAGLLIMGHEHFISHNKAHRDEHSLEVQLPFLQYYLEKEFSIIPMLLGTRSESICMKIAESLQPWFNEDNLFVISADLSHFPDYRGANVVDMLTARSICTNNPGAFLTTLRENEEKNIPNLATSACAWPAILTLMYMTQEDRDRTEYELVRYQNSGDTQRGDKSRVVGYCAITVRKKDYTRNTSFMLSEEDKKVLMDIARVTIEEYIRFGKIPSINAYDYSETLSTHAGAFVTLNKNGKLRGCIGRFQPDKPLYEVVRDMAISASTKDYRFKPVQASELGEIELEISVLTPLEPVSDPLSEVQLGKHGVYIKKGHQSGTFLPQVASSTGWNLEEFLGHCARDKAQIGWFGWKDAEVFVYEALIFHEEDRKHR